ncbi:NACHT domain-containing protein [Fusarium sp. Ph1]|nr:NACHT domain-containing protein [Fusarium sp. Ph1]
MAEALGVASSVIAVVDLSAKVFSLCLRYSREVKNAKGDIERLHKEVADFKTTAEQVQKLLKEPCGQQLEASQQLDSAINHGHATLEKLAQALEPPKHRKAMSRLGVRALKWPFESKDVEGTIQHLARCRGTILLALNVDQTAILQKVDYNIALDRLPIAEGASFDSHAEEHNPTCLLDTRVDLLEGISRWIADPDSKTIYWLNGMAGTGKSTISRTVARSRSKQGDLGASFFFKRGETDRGNLSKVVSTLACQLARNVPGVASVIKQALDADPAIVGKAIGEQFDKLVQGPLSEVGKAPTTPSSVVIVIDALDECERDADIRLLINILSKTKLLQPRLRVFLTSRPELPIRLGFSEVHGTYQDLVLHEIPRNIVEHDIFAFLADEFGKIRESFNLTVGDERKLPSDWPGQQTLHDLTQMAVPLFIFAATVCRFIDNRKRGNPQKQLREVLVQSSRSHRSQLDLTYGPVLRSQITDVSEDDRKQIITDFSAVVGSIIVLASPLSVTALSQLLGVSPEVVDDRLDALHSVLSIPPTRTSPVRLLHLSFRDYLIGPAQKTISEFWVDEKLAHRSLATHCLRLMHGALRENMCELSFPGMRRSAVDALQLEKYIPPQLQYARPHRVHHRTKVDSEPNDSYEIYDFLTTHFLHWLEVLSLMGRARDGLDSLRLLVDWLENRGDSNLSIFLVDAVWFLQANFSVINEAPLQIYSSALVFAPKRSLIRKSFENFIPEWLTTWPQVKHDWDACLLTLEGHSDRVISVVFSHDSTMVASASSDKTVRIWDPKTGKCEHVLEGHSDWVSSVVFSHDLTMVASASDDETVRIWDPKTGKCEHVLEGHSDSVNSVVFSHDSTMMASASDDKTVRIWNTETGICKAVISLDTYAHVLSFTYDERGIVTDIGVFALTGDLESSAEPPMSSRPSEVSTLGLRDGTWVTTTGTDLLWLPTECRSGRAAVSGSTVVIGCRSGRVVFLGFSGMEIAKI